jgi:hypothetical protein
VDWPVACRAQHVEHVRSAGSEISEQIQIDKLIGAIPSGCGLAAMGAVASRLRGGGGGGSGGSKDAVTAYRAGGSSPTSQSRDKDSPRSVDTWDPYELESQDGSASPTASVASSRQSLASSLAPGRAKASMRGAAWASVQLNGLQAAGAGHSSADDDSLPGSASSARSVSSSARSIGGRGAGRFAPGFGRGAGRGGGRGGGRWSRASRARVRQGLPLLPDDRVAPRLSTANRDQTGAALLDLINHGVAALTPEPEPEPGDSSDSELDELQCEVDRFEEMAKNQAEQLKGINPLADAAWIKQKARSAAS